MIPFCFLVFPLPLKGKRKKKTKPWRIKTRSVLLYSQKHRWGYPSWQWAVVVEESQPEKNGNQIRAPFWLSLALVAWIWASCSTSVSLSFLPYKVGGCSCQSDNVMVEIRWDNVPVIVPSQCPVILHPKIHFAWPFPKLHESSFSFPKYSSWVMDKREVNIWAV